MVTWFDGKWILRGMNPVAGFRIRMKGTKIRPSINIRIRPLLLNKKLMHTIITYYPLFTFKIIHFIHDDYCNSKFRLSILNQRAVWWLYIYQKIYFSTNKFINITHCLHKTCNLVLQGIWLHRWQQRDCVRHGDEIEINLCLYMIYRHIPPIAVLIYLVSVAYEEIRLGGEGFKKKG